MSSSVCTQCGSNHLIPGLETIADRNGHPLWVKLREPRQSWIAGDREGAKSEVAATVCGNCGDVRFCAINAADLWKTYTKSQEPKR